MLARFESTISDLPSRAPNGQSDLLIPELLIGSENRLRMHSAPIDWTNRAARPVLLDITPGWTQMELGFRGAAAAIVARQSPDTVARAAKLSGAFAGSIRNNLLRIPDDTGIPNALGISSSSQLFGTEGELLHTTFVSRYSVFESRAITRDACASDLATARGYCSHHSGSRIGIRAKCVDRTTRKGRPKYAGYARC